MLALLPWKASEVNEGILVVRWMETLERAFLHRKGGSAHTHTDTPLIARAMDLAFRSPRTRVQVQRQNPVCRGNQKTSFGVELFISIQSKKVGGGGETLQIK